VLGVTGFGVAVWTAAAAGDPLIERHDETTSGAGDPHEELYLVLEGRATFTVAEEEHDAPAGTCLLVDVGTMRSAVAAEPDTSVLVIGGKPGAALPVSPFEHYYAAQPAYDAGDYDRAVAIASEALADWPDHPLVHYQLACYHALAGRLDEARRSLDIAFAGDERTRAWAAEDEDLAALRA
jgi:tetratricopeptide (TPR) repeat protein